MIRLMLPFHLQTLAGCEAEVILPAPSHPTTIAVIQALEALHPTLRGAILDSNTGKRRPKVRFFACKKDISHHEMTDPLPDEIINGTEPLLIVGAISGG